MGLKVSVAALVFLLPLTTSSLAATVPGFRENVHVPVARTDDERERAAATAYALRREGAISKAQTTDDFAGTRKALAGLMAEPRFTASSASEQRDVVSAAAWVETRSGHVAEAAEFYRRAVQLDPGDPDDWHRLSMAEDLLGHHDAAADALIRILHDWPHLTDALSAGNVLNVVDHLPRESDKRLALMSALFEANWKREEESASELWRELALTLIEQGRSDEARDVIARIAWPDTLMSMQADRRFDGTVPSDPAYVVQSLAELIERLAVLSRENPRNLYTQHEWIKALLAAGRHEEVLELTDDILARIAAETPEQTAFHDSDDQNFTQLYRSRALWRAGRLDEAEAALKRASELPQFGEPNIGQKLSLGNWYNGRMRADEAIDTVSHLPAMAERDDFTRQAAILMHADLLKGDKRRADHHLSTVREGVEGAEEIVTTALLRSGRLDEAAQLFIHRLEAPSLRSAALLAAQDKRTPPDLPGNAVYRHNWDEMMARADVQAALDAVGRVQSYEVW